MPDFAAYRRHAAALLTLGLPLVGSHLAQMAIGVTDNLMLGRYDVTALAAGTLGVSLFFVLFIVGSGFAFAVLPMVANAAAQDDQTQIRRVTRMGLWISTLYGLAVMPPLVFSRPLLLAIGQEPLVAELTAQYLGVLAIGMVPALLVMVLKNYMAALERTRAIFWMTVGGAVLNGLANYALIFGNWGAPEMGVRGAAVASVSVQIATLAAVVVYTRRVFPEHALFQRLWRPDPGGFANVFRLGWPIGLTNLAESGLFSASALMMGWLGALPLAAHGIAVQLASITFVVHLGLSQAATVRAGRAMGERDGHALRQGARVAIALSVGFALVTITIFLTLPHLLVSTFLDAGDPDRPAILAIGTGLLAVAALFQMVDGAQVMALGLLRGLQDTRVPMLHAALSYWVIGVPASYVLGFRLGWGGTGIWLGLVLGLASAALLLMTRFWRRSVGRVPL